MQMAAVSSKASRSWTLSNIVLTDPTTGGVTVGFAMLGILSEAEPEAFGFGATSHSTNHWAAVT